MEFLESIICVTFLIVAKFIIIKFCDNWIIAVFVNLVAKRSHVGNVVILHMIGKSQEWMNIVLITRLTIDLINMIERIELKINVQFNFSGFKPYHDKILAFNSSLVFILSTLIKFILHIV